ncbi:AraC family transcriptional regulator [Micromonospora sp. WMMD882]|uniref:helix-turn-helix transcriptional regulator n=1 Tax=Micromonospora sp. WMMD882 TaxID=3015151 RepID=UPI00248B9A98|nr:AraC family transcriptional regulator [Micromonospora sp. WMMD882]WBB81676.1 AraC family transcriptional regulator [Micromonospora sp. WMMD882]
MVASGHPSPAADAGPPPAPTGIRALTLGELCADPAWRRPVLAPAELLILVTGGHGALEVDFRPLTCRPGSLLRVRPGQALRRADGLDAHVICWSIGALHGLDVGPDTAPTHTQLAGEDEEAVVTEISQLMVDCHRYRGDPTGERLLRHQLAVLLLRLTLTAAVDAPGTELRTFRRLCQEVERNYRYTRRVEDYAERLGCSVRTLTRACLTVTGRSAKQVIDERVALQARRLLAATDEPVARIGRHLGFPEPTNFGRFFSREVGLSPGSFRATGGRVAPTRVARPRPPHWTDRA